MFLKPFYNDVVSHNIKVSSQLEGSYFIAEFKVKNFTYFVDEKFGCEYDQNWKLWDHDVFEVFLQISESEKTPESVNYYEFQVSPLNQPFALEIRKPREDFEMIKGIDFTTKIEIDERDFLIATIKINLESLPLGKGHNHLWGNFHACLGPEKKRNYYSLEWPDKTKLDFHRPDKFIYLEEKK